MVLVSIALLSIMGVAALAIDGGHALSNRTRLHNSLDAAALGAAKVLDTTGNQTLAIQAGNQIFNNNLANGANTELTTIGAASSNLTYEFSNTISPFVPNGAAVNYVRVKMTSALEMPTSFMNVFRQNTVDINTSSIAGPSPTLGEACDIAPVMICGDPTPDDGTFWGYNIGETVTLVLSSPDNTAVGPGNFQLVRLDGNTGGSDIRESIAGSYDSCATVSDTLSTEPGLTFGPVIQGLNTRFGIYNGPVSREQYPPDYVTFSPNNYTDYRNRYFNGQIDESDGVEDRRIMAVPIGNCDGTVNGSGEVEILGLGCIFLTQPVAQAQNRSTITGEIIAECNSGGQPGPDPNVGPGPTKIILYGDTTEWDS